MSADPLVARLRAAGCVWAEDEAALLRAAAAGSAGGPGVAAGDPEGALEALVVRREAGEPLELVVGHARLAGVEVPVAPGVFVPRRRSELLVREAVAIGRGLAPGAGGPLVVVDLCCGSGAVGLAVAVALGGVPGVAGVAGQPPGVDLHAADSSPAAVALASRALAGVGGSVHLGDLDGALPQGLRGRVHLLVAVTPYVPTAELGLLPREARWEPREALDGGPDGLAPARRLVAAAPAWLAPGGALITEVAPRQVPALVSAALGAGLQAHGVDDDSFGAAVVVARRAG